jgi:putative ABC transport system ATP-binding protein
MSDAPRVTVSDLARYHEGGAVRALDGVTFRVSAGEVVALTGPSGCGKSTLLSLLGLLDRPTRGRIVVDDIVLADVRDAAGFRARTVGFVFQTHHMVPTMTLRENIAAPMLPLGVDRRTRLARADALLDAVGLAARARALPARVSGGERQRAAVARALANAPRVLLADEPTGNLDSANGAIVVALLVEAARRHGASVLIATHNPDVAAAADRVLSLRDGRLTGSP